MLPYVVVYSWQSFKIVPSCDLGRVCVWKGDEKKSNWKGVAVMSLSKQTFSSALAPAT